MLPSSEIVLDPTEEMFRFVIRTIQMMWKENLFAINPLLSDPFFHSFTRYFDSSVFYLDPIDKITSLSYMNSLAFVLDP